MSILLRTFPFAGPANIRRLAQMARLASYPERIFEGNVRLGGCGGTTMISEPTPIDQRMTTIERLSRWCHGLRQGSP